MPHLALAYNPENTGNHNNVVSFNDQIETRRFTDRHTGVLNRYKQFFKECHGPTPRANRFDSRLEITIDREADSNHYTKCIVRAESASKFSTATNYTDAQTMELLFIGIDVEQSKQYILQPAGYYYRDRADGNKELEGFTDLLDLLVTSADDPTRNPTLAAQRKDFRAHRNATRIDALKNVYPLPLPQILPPIVA